MITGKFFADTYTAHVGDCYYLLISNKTANKSSPVLYLHQERQSKLVNVDVDSIDFYGLKVKRRWVDSIRKCPDDKPYLIFKFLYQYLNDNGIKKYYYDIWLRNHNYKSSKENKKQRIKINTLKKKGLLNKPDSYIVHITKNMSLKEAAKLSVL